MGWKIHSHTQGSLSLNVAFPSSPVAGKYHWHLMGSRGKRRRGEEQEPKLFYGNTDGCLLWQNASSTTLRRSSLEPLASTGGESPTYSQGGLPSHPDICLISSLSALLTHHAGCCQRSPDDNSRRRSPRSLATVIFCLSFLLIHRSAWARRFSSPTESLELVSLSGSQQVLCRHLWCLMPVLIAFPH